MTLKPWLTTLCVAITALPLLAQPLPCDQFGDGAYCSDTLALSFPFWNQSGSTPDVPDLDGNGIVNILDFITQTRRDGTLKHGLLGQYWGLADGSEDQAIDWPNFASPPYAPSLIQPVGQFDDTNRWDNRFLNTTMRRNFGATFTGWLWVPETATYSMTIEGSRGVRIYLNDINIAEIDSWPYLTTHSGTFQAGMTEIRIEMYADDDPGHLSLTWESNGSMVGPGQKTIGAEYFYHSTVELGPTQETNPMVHFDPPTGRRVPGNQSQLDLNAFIVSPDVNATLSMNGQQVPVANGGYYPRLDLLPGMNRFTFNVEDSSGQTREMEYTVYRDAESLSGSGLFLNAYSHQFQDGAIPIPAKLGLRPWNFNALNSTQLVQLGGRLSHNNVYYGHDTILEMEGLIQITNPGYYRFRIHNDAALEINGVRLANIRHDYRDQWQNRGHIYLDAGNHHYFVRTASRSSSPSLRVDWSFNATEPDNWSSETRVPDGIFVHSSRHHHNPPRPVLDQAERWHRITNDVVAEYLFRPNRPLRDSSGYNHSLTPDPRFFHIPTGGIQLQTGTSLFSTKAGPHVVQRIAETGRFSLEVDFVLDVEPDSSQTYHLISIDSSRNRTLASIRLNGRQLEFWVGNGQANPSRVRFPNVINSPGRYYVVGAYDGGNARIYINSVEQVPHNSDSIRLNHSTSLWQRSANVSVGPRFNAGEGVNDWNNTRRRAMPGRIMTGTVFAVNLSEFRQSHNMNIGRDMNPTAGVAPPPAVVAFPPPGTTSEQLDQAYHVANRLTFGPNPETINEILSMGVNNWIAAQMNPDAIDDSDLDAVLASDFLNPEHYDNDLRGYMFMRMAYSKRQLLEVMTQFWENHFNTQLEKTEHHREELAENYRFREHALGNFADLLMDSAAHFPMTRYLDNDTNIVGAPNENYAREIMELHTVGVNNGYTHDDIIEASRVFTGWSLRNGEFYFDAGLHDYAAKTVFGLNLPAGGGMSDGIAFIRHLTGLRNTADYIAWKLCQLFIADDPPADVVTAASDAFHASQGDIPATLNAIFSHPRFLSDTDYRLNKTKTPLEFVIGLTRATESFPNPTIMPRVISGMGMPLLEFADPTGFPEEGVNWIDTNAMLGRFNFANSLAMNLGSGLFPQIDLKNLLTKYDAETADEILDLFSAITTHGRESDEWRAIALAWLRRDNPNFELTDEQLDTRVRQVLSLYLRLPELNKQ